MPPRRACDVCYKRKIQCCIQVPGNPCDWCHHHDLTCTFAREKQIKKKEQSSLDAAAIDNILRRIERLENAQTHCLSQLSPSSIGTTPGAPREGNVHQSNPFRTSPQDFTLDFSASPNSQSQVRHATTGIDYGDAHFLRRYLGRSWYFKGVQILSRTGLQWISSRTGQVEPLQNVVLGESTADVLPLATLQSRLHSLHEDAYALPHESVTLRVLEVFKRSSSWCVFTVLDPLLFQDTMAKAYHSPQQASQSSASRLSAVACIWAFHAAMSRFKDVKNLSLSVVGERCADMAQSLLGLLITECCVETLQAIILLQMYRMSTGSWQSADALLSIACRTVSDLGAHVSRPATRVAPPTSSTEHRQRHSRALFWLCYALDKDMSLQTGQPPLLVGDYCDLTWQEDPSLLDGTRTPWDAGAREPRYLPIDPRLSVIKEKACRMLYSPGAFNTPDSHLLECIRHLDDELEYWRLSLPTGVRPRLSIPRGCRILSPEMSTLRNLQSIRLQLEYHYMLTTIHMAVRRCGASVGDGDLPEDLHSVIHSSVDLSLEASRSTLLFLKEAINVLEEDSIHYIPRYSLVAAMSLFVNVVVHPLGSQAQADLEALVAGTGAIQTIPLRNLSGDETEQIRDVNNFILELVRLGNCALWEAKKNSLA
ncbi:hypothetical protein VTK73DRAFT_195 [Phialemonium thermophilum]|uniref:Zn(2)-C6 fungal-type domain-containing protein n=1 Tax=Phialemonium thermophilum TaxID=223376 RepID=A0ABR3XFQ0_9PEZI